MTVNLVSDLFDERKNNTMSSKCQIKLSNLLSVVTVKLVADLFEERKSDCELFKPKLRVFSNCLIRKRELFISPCTLPLYVIS